MAKQGRRAEIKGVGTCIVEHPVLLHFDKLAMGCLYEQKKRKDFPGIGHVIHEALEYYLGLEAQAEEGFTELLVRNPETGKVRKLNRVTLRSIVKAVEIDGESDKTEN